MGLNLREQYAWCIYLSLTGLSWAFAGWVGILLMNAGFWIGSMDLSLIDKIEAGNGHDPDEQPDPVEVLPDNVVVLPPPRRRKVID